MTIKSKYKPGDEFVFRRKKLSSKPSSHYGWASDNPSYDVGRNIAKILKVDIKDINIEDIILVLNKLDWSGNHLFSVLYKNKKVGNIIRNINVASLKPKTYDIEWE
jgi:hypothetical protein